MRSRVRKFAHILERFGLALAGAASGLFVAIHVGSSVSALTSQAFLLIMMLGGAIGFYLGIDVPRPPMRATGRIDAVELMSAGGIFLAALAALVSVYGIIFDEIPPRAWEFVIGSWWFGGIVMLATAGLLGRRRPTQKVAAMSAGPIRDQRLRR